MRLNGAVVTHFLPMEAALDGAVGSGVHVEVERGGKPVAAALAVQDLHAVTPAALLQVAGAILHALSYQQVRSVQAPGSRTLCSRSQPPSAPCLSCQQSVLILVATRACLSMRARQDT